MYNLKRLNGQNIINLDGLWQLDGKDIIVPYAPQSKKSHFIGAIKEEMTYVKIFKAPDLKDDERLILHFGAVDQIADVYLNDVFLMHHEDGYLPFSLDISEALKKENVLKVICHDALDKDFPYGKQSANPKGMWYTPVSFIWRSVWLERVPAKYIKDIKIKTTMTTLFIKIQGDDLDYELIIDQDDVHYRKAFHGDSINIDLKAEGLPIHLWDTEHPYLYHFKLRSKNDEIGSYFALREFKIAHINNYERFLLNGKAIFLCGLLDQGYFGENIYTAFKEDYERDIINAKSLGFNCLRKHLKIEDKAFYEACDRLGILVIQDFVNSGDYNFLRDTALPNIGFKTKNDQVKHQKRHDIFIKHGLDVQELLNNHPSVIAYTIFNEGWGQFAADQLYQLFKSKDEDHIYDATSGWFKRSVSDLESEHLYFRNKILKSHGRALLLSECGGYVYAPQDKSYGYGSSKDLDAHMHKIKDLYEKMIIPSIKYGLNGFIYTQLNDVESERNGLFKDDHRSIKVDASMLKKLNEACINEFIEQVNK